CPRARASRPRAREFGARARRCGARHQLGGTRPWLTARPRPRTACLTAIERRDCDSADAPKIYYKRYFKKRLSDLIGPVWGRFSRRLERCLLLSDRWCSFRLQATIPTWRG